MHTEFKYEIGHIIHGKYSNSLVLDRYIAEGKYPSIKHKNYKTYLCRCLNDGNEFELLENEVTKNKNCPICGRLKWERNQTIEALYPEVVKYLVNKEEAGMYRANSSRKLLCACPECGLTKEVTVHNLCKNGFSCNKCGDGISYPNKFIHALLDELGIIHTPEKSFDWSNGKIYDQYLKDHNMIIENHGQQHYIDKSAFIDQTLEMTQLNDKYKYDLAMNNGIEHYIVIDCSYSNMDYIKNSIMNSDLPNLLSFKEDDIDWCRCDLFASTSLKIAVWKEWNINQDLQNLIDKFNLSGTTLIAYIRQGYKDGKCPDYTKQFNKMAIKDNRYNRTCCKPIYCETDNIYFATRYDCEDYYKDFFPEKTGSYELYIFINKNKTYKGKKFSYITQEDFNYYKHLSEKNNTINVIGDYFEIKNVS